MSPREEEPGVDFALDFAALTGHTPFPWQAALFHDFLSRGIVPRSCTIPTGLGKTAVLAVWLIALARRATVPRRLVYIVNRRTVVDQTTREAEKLKGNAGRIGISDLAISTLRGQYADNREWSADPSRPAIICGTVDMIGSRLLFSGYGVGFKARPLHAGFLGQDVLLVHDEAHLEPAFQRLIDRIVCEQSGGRCDVNHHHCTIAVSGPTDFRPLRVMQLTATERASNGEGQGTSGLTRDEKNPPETLPDQPTEPIHHVWRRLKAVKGLELHEVADDKAVADSIARLALKHKDSGGAVLVFVRRLKDVDTICTKLKKAVGNDQIERLTGTMRGLERDHMADPRRDGASRVFARFLRAPSADAPESERWRVEPMPGTVYLVCTSAGEVGVDISADHMICDLSPLESMAQRLGRLNRYGDRGDTRVAVVYPEKLDEKDPLTLARRATLNLLRKLPEMGRTEDDKPIYDASPKSLGDLMAGLSDKERMDAFSPEPTILPATDILFDAWALTSIRARLPGRPHVEPYLHGLRDWEPPETHVAWREEVERITGDLLTRHPSQDLLDDYPLKPHELLRDCSDRVLEHLQTLAREHPDAPAWLVDDDGRVMVHALSQIADPGLTKGKGKNSLIERIAGCTVALPPSMGGLSEGVLDGQAQPPENGTLDVADELRDPADPSRPLRVRVRSDDPEYDQKTSGMRPIRSIELGDESDETGVTWDWFVRAPEGTRTAPRPVLWCTHVDDVESRLRDIVGRLDLGEDLTNALTIAARLHDHGKRREQFQAGALGNRRYPEVVWAKGGRRAARLPEVYRHEFGSLIDAEDDAEFKNLSPDLRDLVLHIIAAHHGRARPHFTPEEALDPDHGEAVTLPRVWETPRRFAWLQRRYGRWGLAYLESILRAADWAASAEPSAFVEQHGPSRVPAEAAS
ncbi:MAG: type I-U CRISPR-associated helicase/endonuclease Cas3 [Phycisphaeraceae bacterium]|nr:type I-U CRISPR-associated helicase/endonuclease Cas3 [Phycisphaeraceae bacterium]